MSSTALAYPATVGTERPRNLITPDSILNDERQRRYFAALSDHYSSLLSEIERDVHFLSDLGNVTYLIDTDVIRNFVEISYSDDFLRRETERLFRNPNFRYALPFGAFQEIFEWLRRLTPRGISLGQNPPFAHILGKGNVDASETIRRLARALNLPGTDDPVSLIERLASTLERDKLHVERFIDLMTRENFEGIVHDFDLGDAVQLEAVIQRRPRVLKKGLREEPKAAQRSHKDYRDAVNLAITFKNYRTREGLQGTPEREAVPTYLLVTQTQVLLDLVKRANERDDDSLHILSTLLDLPGAQVVEGTYPVFSPRRAFTVEEFRREHGFGDHPLSELRTLRRDYEDLGGALRGSPPKLRSDNVVLISTLIREKLDRLNMIYARDPFYRSLENERATEKSIQYLREKLKPGSIVVDKKATMLELEAQSFVKVLHESQALLEDLSMTSYIARHETDDTRTFESIIVYSNNPTEQILQGEMYLRAPADASLGYRSFSLRWQTNCTEKQFFEAIERVVVLSADRRPKHKSIVLREMFSFADVKAGGIVVFTSLGVYGTAFVDVPVGLSLGEVSMRQLRKALLLACKGKNADPMLWAVRVCTPFGDFQLDLDSNESGEREVFVISRYDIGQQIAHLCESTSLFTILPRRLETLLRKQVYCRFGPFNHQEN